MKEHGILFSAPMVRALLAGTKTQTRRVVKPPRGWPQFSECDPFAMPPAVWWWNGEHKRVGVRQDCPYGQPGDRLRVKEAAWLWCERRPNGKTKTGRQKWRYEPMRAAGIWYAADHRAKPNINVVSPDTGNEWGWRLKIGRFLPRWASRITLEITAVRVERLQDISEADAMAEGITHSTLNDPRVEYRWLWESINGPDSWDANPWLWVLEFKRV